MADPKKRIHVGRFVYTIDEASKGALAVAEEITQAMASGEVVTVEVLDDNDRQMVLYLNGSMLESVAVDFGKGPRPTEIS